MSSADPIFELDKIVVQYGKYRAVDRLSLTLQKGESLGLLGANGAGKTSTLKALLGMHRPTDGAVRVFGGPTGTPSVLKRLGFAPEESIPPERFTGREYLDFVASFRISDSAKRKDECATLLEELDLAPHKRVSAYSKGMKRRLVLAQALVGSPEFLILDEPLNGLDPLIIVKLRQRLEKYLQGGGSILYSSHILAEVEKTCRRIVILRRGEVVYEGTTAETITKYGSVEAAFEATAGTPT